MPTIDHIQQSLTPIADEFERATAMELQEIAALLAGSLPSQLQEFLQNFGGAGFNGEAQIELQTGQKEGVFTLFAASRVRQDLTDHEDYVSNGWAPIADDLFNNRYVVEVATGHVIFLEYGGGQCRSTLVAPNFEAFIASIQVTQDE